MAHHPALTSDGYEIQFSTNHVGHALLIKLVLPTLQRTAVQLDADVRIVSNTSLGFESHPYGGIAFDDLSTKLEFPSSATGCATGRASWPISCTLKSELARR
ncbi:hypothetical protein N7G274_003394 [Stereocaulon virgatum]|uniref:Uncharacterized protein n=1 Tax=Stereocaulon virgatum TaxID=373712 RepID=A0ABR4ADH1_9LECA